MPKQPTAEQIFLAARQVHDQNPTGQTHFWGSGERELFYPFRFNTVEDFLNHFQTLPPSDLPAPSNHGNKEESGQTSA